MSRESFSVVRGACELDIGGARGGILLAGVELVYGCIMFVAFCSRTGRTSWRALKPPAGG